MLFLSPAVTKIKGTINCNFALDSSYDIAVVTVGWVCSEVLC